MGIRPMHPHMQYSTCTAKSSERVSSHKFAMQINRRFGWLLWDTKYPTLSIKVRRLAAVCMFSIESGYMLGQMPTMVNIIENDIHEYFWSWHNSGRHTRAITKNWWNVIRWVLVWGGLNTVIGTRRRTDWWLERDWPVAWHPDRPATMGWTPSHRESTTWRCGCCRSHRPRRMESDLPIRPLSGDTHTHTQTHARTHAHTHTHRSLTKARQKIHISHKLL